MKLAVIPARGGSKRIPRKNIRSFHGRPIIEWSIEAALRTGLFDRVIVSTDDVEIAEVSIRAGAEVPFVRPAELSDDRTGTNAVVAHALTHYAEHGERVDLACCIYATAPFVTATLLKEGHDRLVERGHGFAFSVTSFPFPIQRALRIRADGALSMFYPEHLTTRSQDLEDAWHDAGQFYWGYPDAFLRGLPIYSTHASAVIVPRHRVQDIDTPEDWRRAEILFSILAEAGEVET